MNTWWDKLDDIWKDLFMINYVYQFRYSEAMRAEQVSVGTNPFDVYKMKQGRDFRRFEPDEEEFEEMRQLEFFYASNCSLGDVQPLVDFSNIQLLDIFNNHIKDLSCLRKFENLREVYIETNSIESLDFLENSRNLETLFARDNLLQEVDVLCKLKNLIFVDVSTNGWSSSRGAGLSELSCLKNANRLRELQCANNKLVDLSFLAGHPALEILDCSANSIDDASFLFELPKLKFVDISDNPIEKSKYDWKKLTDNGVELVMG